jgi:hypothetical protein
MVTVLITILTVKAVLSLNRWAVSRSPVAAAYGETVVA